MEAGQSSPLIIDYIQLEYPYHYSFLSLLVINLFAVLCLKTGTLLPLVLATISGRNILL